MTHIASLNVNEHEKAAQELYLGYRTILPLANIFRKRTNTLQGEHFWAVLANVFDLKLVKDWFIRKPTRRWTRVQRTIFEYYRLIELVNKHEHVFGVPVSKYPSPIFIYSIWPVISVRFRSFIRLRRGQIFGQGQNSKVRDVIWLVGNLNWDFKITVITFHSMAIT